MCVTAIQKSGCTTTCSMAKHRLTALSLTLCAPYATGDRSLTLFILPMRPKTPQKRLPRLLPLSSARWAWPTWRHRHVTWQVRAIRRRRGLVRQLLRLPLQNCRSRRRRRILHHSVSTRLVVSWAFSFTRPWSALAPERIFKWGRGQPRSHWRQRLGNFGGWIDAKGKVSWGTEVAQWGPGAKTH